MAALVWLLIPLAAAVAAAIWGRWATHHRSTADGASLAGYERFRQAMQNSTPPIDDSKDAATATARAGGAGRTAKSAAAAEDRATAAAEGEEDSPRGPVAGQVP